MKNALLLLLTLFLLPLQSFGLSFENRSQNDLSGRWQGIAQVEGKKFLKSGNFNVSMAIYQSGEKLRGFIDVNQNAGLLAEAFGYYFEGKITGNKIKMEFTDRHCSSGESNLLCSPTGDFDTPMLMKKIFDVSGIIENGSIVFTEAQIKQGIEYPVGTTIEPPFVALNVSPLINGSFDSKKDIAGKWVGPLLVPQSVVYAGIPMFGDNEMTIEKTSQGYEMSKFDNNGINIYPTDKEIILAETFKYNPVTHRFWFVQTRSMDARWLYVGELRGNRLVGALINDAIAGGVWASDKEPIDPLELPFDYSVTGNFFFNLK